MSAGVAAGGICVVEVGGCRDIESGNVYVQDGRHLVDPGTGEVYMESPQWKPDDPTRFLTARPQRAKVAPDAARPNGDYAQQIDAAARKAGIDPALVHAVVAVESGYRPRAVSPKGAVGLMQVMPETALRYGVTNPAKVSGNLNAGTRHLRRLMDKYDNRLDLALAAYNAGEGAVERHNNTVPPYRETRHYVPAVMAKYKAASRRTRLR